MKFTERITSTAKLVQSLGLAMLLFCFAPVHAQSEGFKSTSAYQLNASVQKPNAVNQYNAYRSTIYQPFSESAPSGNSPSGGPSKINDRRNAVIGIPGWGDTMSEPLPIGDTVPLFLFAAAMIAIIWIKQRKQQLQSITTTNNNNNTTQMTPRKQTYQSLRQKLFLLLAFVCIAGQVSAEKKTIYFRPSTVGIDNGYAGSWGLTSATTAHNVSWAKLKSDARFLVLEKKSDGTYAEYWEYKLAANILPTATDKTALYSRFIPTELESTSSFAIYRIQKGHSTLAWDQDQTKEHKYNCIPNNEWWNGQSDPKSIEGRANMLFSMSDLGDCNMVAIREGYWATGREDKWKGYYFGYYLEEDAHIYFDNKNDWTAPTFLRGKDIYAYSHNLTQISGTDLWYCKLAKPTADDVESGIAYTQYAFISQATTKTENTQTFTKFASGTEDPYLWKRWPHNSDDDSDLSYSEKDNNSFDKLRQKTGYSYTAAVTGDKLSGETNLYIPGAANNATVQKHTLNGGWQDLNHTHTVTIETGGKLNYLTTWLTGASSSDTDSEANNTGTITFQAAYTASVTLRAIPDDGYVFLGFYDAEKNEMLSRGVQEPYNSYPITHRYTYDAPNSAQKIIAKFVKGNSTRNFSVRTMIYDNGLKASLEGGTFTMTHSGGITYTHAKIGYHDMYVSNAPVTFEATPNSGYEFIGWFNYDDDKRYPDKSWTIDDPTNTTKYKDQITAIFASTDYAKKQNINIEGPGTVKVNYFFYDNTPKETTFEQSSSFVAWDSTSVKLTATPLAGYKFDGWYEGETRVSTAATYSYTANAAQTITAKFKSAVNKLTVSVFNYNTSYNEFREYEYEYNKVTLKQGNSVLKESYSSFSYTFDNDASVTITATPESEEETGYDFVGWYQSDTLVSDNATYTMQVIGMQAISARFAPKKCHKLTLVPNSGGTYTVHYGKDKNTYPDNFYSVESSLTDTVIAYMPYEYNYTVSSAKPILGYKFKHHDAAPLSVNKYDFTLGKFHSSVLNKSHDVVVSFVRDEEQVVYLDLNGKWDDNNSYKYWVFAYDTTRIYDRRDTIKSTNEIKIKHGTYKWIEMNKCANIESLYTCTLPADTFSHIAFIQLNATINPTTHISQHINNHHTKFFTIPATRYNCMRLQWAWNSTTRSFEDAWTDAPTEEGDYRLIYIEQTVISDDSIRIDYDFSTNADLIKKRANGKDIVSLHIYNKVSENDFNGMNNPEVILQRCTSFVDGKSQWEDVERHLVFGPLRFEDAGSIRMPRRKNATVVGNLGISNIIDSATPENDYACGVWNFTIQQNEDGTSATLLLEETEEYEGNYYIRTTNAPGQYNNYTHPGNIISESEYAKNHSNYSHYYIRDVNINEDGTPTGEAGKHPLVKFAIANDYARFLNYELLIEQKRFADDNYTDVFVKNDNGSPNLPADASVRFGWDIVTNRLTRAYIANTTIKNNEYLVVEGDNIGTPTGDATYFTDNSNWLYSIDLPNATTGAAAKVKAKMNGQYQYFMGSESENETLISGNGTNTYPIRLLYDFKDDRFTTIYRPSGQLNGDISVNTPLMIEREHNYAPTQIQLTTNTVTSTGTGEDQYTQPAYAVMTFLESVLADASKTHHEKMFYWVSFPFDVKISNVFGLGDYGQYWIMQYYDGAQRALHGLAQTNWKYILDTEAILKANKGYIICLNYNQILQDQLFKSYGGSDKTLNSGKLSLYFPSNGVVSPAAIKQQQDPVVVKLDQHPIGQNIAWNHWNWHVIGVPSFADPDFSTTQGDVPFFYQYWHPTDGYAAVASTEVDFYAMHSYMVQYAGDIKWTSVVNTAPQSLAARRDAAAEKRVMLRLELQQAGNTLDKTYLQLRNDRGTLGFDLNLDLSKVINAGANIYSVVSGDQMAGNAIPKEETVIPIGVVITTAGNYTFAMPNGTGGMIVELIDYEQGTSTNLLAMDYTVNLPKATNNTRFALRLKPNKVATSLKNIGNGTTSGDAVRKLLIDGVLYLQKGNLLYDAQGRYVQ